MIVISSRFFAGTGEYFWGVVDADYNSGPPIANQAQSRNFTAVTWTTACRFWDDARNWTTDGCRSLPNSTQTTTLCGCNHLTVFGGNLQILPNDLTFVNVDDLFE